MTDELHTLSGAYAVHALPYAEWVLFEKHLHTCQGCAIEVRRLRETAARLAEAVAEPPPARLRRRLLAAAHRSRSPEDVPERVRDDSPTVWRPPQERGPTPPPPDAPTIGVPTIGAPPGPRQEQPPTLSLPSEPVFRIAAEIPVTPEGRHAGGPGDGPGDGPAGGSAGGSAGGQVVPLRRRRRAPKVMAALTAVSAAAAVVLGVVAFDARRDMDDLRAGNEEMIAVLAAPDAETMRQPITTGGTGVVVISRARGSMVFTSSGLRGLPGTQDYELWLMGPDGPRPGGLLDQREDGLTSPMVLEPLGGDDHVALTVEPKGGSAEPTSSPIMLAELPQA